MSRRRLEAEPIRDALLVIAGEMDWDVGGNTIRSGTRSDLGYDFSSSRRSVYVPVFRNSQLDVGTAFDMADPNIVVGNRTRSVLPTQALLLMNSPLTHECAQAAAARVLQTPPEERLGEAFLQVLARLPEPEERALMESILDDAEPLTAWKQVFQLLFCSLDFRYVD